jgi:hypothetical protein
MNLVLVAATVAFAVSSADLFTSGRWAIALPLTVGFAVSFSLLMRAKKTDL